MATAITAATAREPTPYRFGAPGDGADADLPRGGMRGYIATGSRRHQLPAPPPSASSALRPGWLAADQLRAHLAEHFFDAPPLQVERRVVGFDLVTGAVDETGDVPEHGEFDQR